MKNLYLLLLTILATSCSSIQLHETWKNPDITDFNPKNVLVIGVTPDLKARSNFEFALVRELNARNINAIQSSVVFEKLFQDPTKTEAEIEAQINKLLTNGFETIFVSAIKGVSKNESRSGASPKFDYKLQRFLGGYLASRDDYFNQNDYSKYEIFYVETSIYEVKEDQEKHLIWFASHDIIDPNDMNKTTDEFIQNIIKSLEKERLVAKKIKKK